MRSQLDVVMRHGTMPSNFETFRDFNAMKREEASLLVRCLLRREGLESDVRCSAGRLSISFRGMASPDFEPDDTAGLLSVFMAIAHLLGEEHNVGPDFVIDVDFWGKGSMVTTVGRATTLSARMQETRLTADEFQQGFDFRLSEPPARWSVAG